jgi:hypothetical protein
MESCYTLNTKVVQNVTITALTKNSAFCIGDERTTEFSVSAGWLPEQLGNFPQIAFFGHAKWKFAARSKANFEAYGILYLLTMLKNDSLNMLGYEIFCDCCFHSHVNAQMSYCHACLHLSSLSKKDFGYVSNKGMDQRNRGQVLCRCDALL